MTNGYINQRREAVIPVDIFDRQGRLRRVEAIVDTGFDYFLALPSHLVLNLGLPFLNKVAMRVATEQMADFDSFAAIVWWFGSRRRIRVLQSQSEILVGTRLLWDNQLTIQLWEGGVVTVQGRPA